jgi:hypothetical protein
VNTRAQLVQQGLQVQIAETSMIREMLPDTEMRGLMTGVSGASMILDSIVDVIDNPDAILDAVTFWLNTNAPLIASARNSAQVKEGMQRLIDALRKADEEGLL